MVRKLITLGVFVLLVAIGTVLALGVTGEIPVSGLPSVWFYSGLVLMLFATFYIEPVYTAPKNVLAHGIAVILVCLSVRDGLYALTLPLATLAWRILFFYASTMMVISWAAIVVQDDQRGSDHVINRSSAFLKNIAVLFGNARVLYSGVFLIFLPLLHDLRSPWVMGTLVFWWFLVVTEPARHLAKALARLQPGAAGLGEVFSVQSSGVFLARGFKDAPTVHILDPVEFAYSIDGDARRLRRGIVVEKYLLDDEHWLRVLELGTSTSSVAAETNVLRPVPASDRNEFAALGRRLVGLVSEQSDIRKIQFELVSGSPQVEEGDLLECLVGDRRIFYQVVNGATDVERLEEKNETGLVRGEAIQLGEWDKKRQAFQAYGWVPKMNSPVLKTEADIEVGKILPPEHLLGVLPGTQVSLPIDLEKARSHHFAVLGVTGAGKTFITLELIREMTKTANVICVDFTGEYLTQLSPCTPSRLIDKEKLAEVEALMAAKADAAAKRGEKAKEIEHRTKIQERLYSHVETFMGGEGKLAVFELPDMSNTSFILEFTQMFLDAVFRYAKENPGQKVCLVVEEAHTVIPETTSLGDFGDYSSNKALVNKISQIALQGRKYGVGFWIIAQRTANVSKTVLTQCNSLLCFQAFDETSYRFLENHLGRHLVDAIPRLRQYHAIAVGKAFRGNIPLIVDLRRPEDSERKTRTRDEK